MHLADAFIQSDLQYIQAIHLFCQYVCSLRIEPTTFVLLTQCFNHWATGTLILLLLTTTIIIIMYLFKLLFEGYIATVNVFKCPFFLITQQLFYKITQSYFTHMFMWLSGRALC